MTEVNSSGIRDFYNDIAHEFSEEWYANDSMTPVLRQFVALLPSSPAVLDLGCGAGYESMRLKKLGAEVTGIDYSEEPIRIARQKNPDCRFEVMDFRDMDSGLGSFDGIVSIASLVHIPEEGLSIVFRNIKKVLRDNGYIMAVVMDGHGLSEERSFVERDGKKYERYFYLHDKERLSETAKNAGIDFLSEMELPEEYVKYGWKCFLFGI